MVRFEQECCKIYNKVNELVAIADLVNNIYKLRVKTVKKEGQCLLTSSVASASSAIWHRRLGHINYKDTCKMQAGVVEVGVMGNIAEESTETSITDSSETSSESEYNFSSDTSDTDFVRNVIITNQTLDETVRRSSRVPKPKNFEEFATYMCASGEMDVDPISVNEALSGPESVQWRQAMKEKYQSFIDNEAWELVDVPDGANIRKDFKDSKMRENSWEEICAAMGETVEDCQRVWRNLRDRYVRERKIAKDTPSGAAAVEPKWSFYKNLVFLEKHILPRRPVSRPASATSSASLPSSVEPGSPYDTMGTILSPDPAEQSEAINVESQLIDVDVIITTPSTSKETDPPEIMATPSTSRIAQKRKKPDKLEETIAAAMEGMAEHLKRASKSSSSDHTFCEYVESRLYADQKLCDRGTGGGSYTDIKFSQLNEDIKQILGARIEGEMSQFDGDQVMAHQRQYLNLSKMSDQEIIELMDSIPTDDEGTSNDEEGDFDSDIDRKLLPPPSASSSSKDETAVILEPVAIQPSMPSTSTETEQGVMPPLTRTFKRRKRVRSPELVEEVQTSPLQERSPAQLDSAYWINIQKYNEEATRNRLIDPAEVQRITSVFDKSVTTIRQSIDTIVNEASNLGTDGPTAAKRRHPSRNKVDHRVAALEVCDIIINNAKERFAFTDHLVAATLFCSEKFVDYIKKFPDNELNLT
ncbi:hypothetical protein NQ314_008586 [Rhamnusium bicolor]|uniref:MADF domain-containing protein n=1 Tax=Rhamnusium bicolor TaxID=1586634 RepID=A0AAV8Y7Z8_9CUCU|nr:hypothetical protein NQ314_008586 [Rhamnusium bicolor]